MKNKFDVQLGATPTLFIGLISRKVTQSRSVTVSYSLTKLGQSFMVPANTVCRWINRNRTGLRATIDLAK
jgi:DNA-binding HxlR family transcriptional regulator